MLLPAVSRLVRKNTRLVSIPNSLKIFYQKRRKSCVILGIETSCDDTGCAIVNNDGVILGEALNSQTNITVEMGGVMPILAKELHEKNIENVVNKALNAANMSVEHVDAVAVTTKPGIIVSLSVGTSFGKKMCQEYGKPLIPIHHMQAHTLTARIVQPIEFPFLTLLISGGHCLLAIAQSPVKFQLLGQSLNDAPGEALDKVARRLKLRFVPEFSKCSGGESIERAARKGYPVVDYIVPPMLSYRDCNFSFSGMKQRATQHILKMEGKHDIMGSTLIPDAYDLCASFLHTMATHLCHRVQRAIMFADLKALIPPDRRVLVVSGGVACNSYIRQGLEIVCRELGYKLVVPPPKLCTDNGVMIAWNGVEKFRLGIDVIPSDQLQSIDIEPKSPIGEDISNQVAEADIKLLEC
ncbi:probable tRNA N6-adenosine threonylcarbamoyltransferase, mitochondrial isoform X2 [Nilaparvata lugens]|uniref:probable tRNA N6-adenosine threonylcarbamoyltransferase, mitochondrial isoform X2 n=1 Tax=Nilaparvata lugens TaxID=108931 RepID=UPI00193C8E77|nr:probable tRNA N6-adenosine threonylcarbamoyltransferase, mitochondrial isoform X2 [Nilaparvata lugens]